LLLELRIVQRIDNGRAADAGQHQYLMTILRRNVRGC
jgi:hypothetical protein